jgi:hypothetical protein
MRSSAIWAIREAVAGKSGTALSDMHDDEVMSREPRKTDRKLRTEQIDNFSCFLCLCCPRGLATY